MPIEAGKKETMHPVFRKLSLEVFGKAINRGSLYRFRA